MNHNEAKQLQAAEKYLLGELTPNQREEYEEHCFDCADCALDLKAMAAFADNAREVLRQEKVNSVVTVRASSQGGWFSWLKPIVAVPVFAVLLLVIGYQNTFTIPQAEKRAAQGTALVLGAPPSTLRGANVRGEEELRVPVHADSSFSVQFDFTPRRTFDQYLCQLQDETGHAVLQLTFPGTSTNREVQLAVPGGLVHAGKYSLVFTGGGSGMKGQPTADEVLRLTFTIEIQP
jgi:hypothetical protein